MPFNASAFLGGNNKTTSKMLVIVQKNILISFTVAAAWIKASSNLWINSGCRLHEQGMSEFSYELNLSSQHRHILGQSTFLDQVASTEERL